MPTVKIADIPRPCTDREHNPPSHQVFDEGIWEHTCPSCGYKTRFTVTKPTLAPPPPIYSGTCYYCHGPIIGGNGVCRGCLT